MTTPPLTVLELCHDPEDYAKWLRVLGENTPCHGGSSLPWAKGFAGLPMLKLPTFPVAQAWLAEAWSAHYGLIVIGIAVVLQAALITGLFLSRARLQRLEKSLRMSEELYREVVESQTEMVCRYRRDTTLTFVNEAYCRFFGKTREELLGRKFIDFVPENAKDGVRQSVEKLQRERQHISTEHEVLLPDGRIGWHHWEDYPVLESNDTVEEFQGIGRDITKRRAAEEALRTSEERMHLAAEAANLGLWVWDVTQDRVWMSENWRAQHGLPAGEPVSRDTLWQFVHPEDRAPAVEILRKVMAGESRLETEFRSVRPGGEIRWVQISGRRELGADGAVARISGVGMDVTGRKKAEEASQNLVHAARLATIGELTASLAHEMNQPLGAIFSNAEAAELLLESGTPPLDEIREILADIRKDDLRACETMKRVRDLSRKHESEKSPLDLNQVVSEVIPLVAMDARRRRVAMKTELMPGLAPVRGNRVHLQQVLLNLVVNAFDAMDATPEPERRLEIQTALTPVGDVEISVTDHGPGIADADLPRVCESFFTTKKNGVGLGLAIARTIVEEHRGRLSAENHAGGGAKFCITMPTNGH